MYVLLTANQLAIVDRVKRHFGNALCGGKVRSMFRGEGPDMSVGLSYSEMGHHFIVRTVVPSEASNYTIDDQCGRLAAQLAASVAKVLRNTP